MSFADGSLLKQPCGCGDRRCKAFGAINPSTGHSRKCWPGCEVCAKAKRPSGTSRRIPTMVKRQVMARANGFCEARIPGVCTGEPEHLHHIRMRSQGGGESVANLVAVCLEDHRWIHDHPQEAAERGLLARTSSEPLSSAVTKVTRIR